MVGSKEVGNVSLFGRDSGTPLWSTEGYPSLDRISPNSVSISADGEYIAAGAGGVYLFHRDNDTPLWSIPTTGELQAMDMSVMAAPVGPRPQGCRYPGVFARPPIGPK